MDSTILQCIKYEFERGVWRKFRTNNLKKSPTEGGSRLFRTSLIHLVTLRGWLRIQHPRSGNNTNFMINTQEKAATRVVTAVHRSSQ